MSGLVFASVIATDTAVRTSDFDFDLPEGLIAQEPLPDRGASRLLVLDRNSGLCQESRFARLEDWLRPGDLLVLNDSRVIPARLRGRKVDGTSRLEIFLLEPVSEGTWNVLLRPGKRVRAGTHLELGEAPDLLRGTVVEKADDGVFTVRFEPPGAVQGYAERHGEVPLPPYITRDRPRVLDRERYQTVYAQIPGSVAAPTAGLHFSPDHLEALRRHGVETCQVTLHVGMGTFAPVKVESVEDHVMHAETYEVTPTTVDCLERARRDGRRIVAVGTTSLRVLESVAREHGGHLRAGTGRTCLYLFPPADFQVVQALLTNFHLPRSTLLMLVSAFAAPGSTRGCDLIRRAYHEAIARRFRFFSYGDAMLIL